MEKSKLRVIQDYEKLGLEIKEQIKLVYSALPFETFDKIYMVRMSKILADQIIDDDDDYDDDGNLKIGIKDKYEDKHSDVEYLSENDNYD